MVISGRLLCRAQLCESQTILAGTWAGKCVSSSGTILEEQPSFDAEQDDDENWVESYAPPMEQAGLGL